MQGIARGGYQGGGAVILHYLNLFHDIFPGVGNYRGSDFFRSVMKTESSGGQTVVKGNLNEIVSGNSGGTEYSGYQ